MDFVQVGYQRDGTETRFLIVLAAALLIITVLKRPPRFDVLFLVAGILLVLVFNIPTLLDIHLLYAAGLAGSIVDHYRREQRTPKNAHVKVRWAVLVIAVFFTVANVPGSSISVAGGVISGWDKTVGSQEEFRDHVQVLKLTGGRGEVQEWRIQPDRPAKAAYIVRLPGSAMYRTGPFTFFSSTKVAERIAAWAQVKVLHRSYEEYVEMGRHDLANP